MLCLSWGAACAPGTRGVGGLPCWEIKFCVKEPCKSFTEIQSTHCAIHRVKSAIQWFGDIHSIVQPAGVRIVSSAQRDTLHPAATRPPRPLPAGAPAGASPPSVSVARLPAASHRRSRVLIPRAPTPKCFFPGGLRTKSLVSAKRYQGDASQRCRLTPRPACPRGKHPQNVPVCALCPHVRVTGGAAAAARLGPGRKRRRDQRVWDEAPADPSPAPPLTPSWKPRAGGGLALLHVSCWGLCWGFAPVKSCPLAGRGGSGL